MPASRQSIAPAHKEIMSDQKESYTLSTLRAYNFSSGPAWPKGAPCYTPEPFRALASKPNLPIESSSLGKGCSLRRPKLLTRVGGFFVFRARQRDLIMAKVIEFYIPIRFQKKVAWVSPEERGKVIEFRSRVKKSASWELQHS